MSWPRRILSLFRRRRLEQDLDAEMRLHVDLQTEENIEAGISGGHL